MESNEAVENAYRQHALGKGYILWCGESRHTHTGGLRKYSKKSGRKVVVFGCDRGKCFYVKALKSQPGSARIEAPKRELELRRILYPACVWGIIFSCVHLFSLSPHY